MIEADKSAIEPLFSPWVSTLKMKSVHTARSYKHAVADFLTLMPSKIGPQDMADYIESLDGLSPATRAHHISAVKTYLKFCQRQGAMAQTMLDFLVRPRVTVTSFNRYLNIEEIRALAKAAAALSPRHYAAIVFLVGTGLRISEAVGASWRDVYRDPQGRLGLRVLGKGDKERVVRLRDDVFAALVVLHGSDRLDAKDQTPLIPSTRGGQRYTTRGFFKVVARAVKRADLDKPCSPHWLRHSHATLAALGGASVFAIKDSLGHADIQTSQRYIHWAKGLDETTVDSLPAFG